MSTPSTSTSPEQIRADIEVTREELGRDVDALADKVTPGKIVERQKSRMRRAFEDVRHRIMGVAEDVGNATSDVAESAAEGVRELPKRAAGAAQGAPIAVGLVALGLGWLAASLAPPSAAERRMARSLRESAQPIVDSATDAAKEVASGLQEPAREAFEQVKSEAVDAADHVKTEARDTTEHVKERVTSSSGDQDQGVGLGAER
ncbi:DUF3618 domain-containing protein [Microbacterium immunditiarum]|uniref:ElaB/YqjD/DUF883 family membrane-anchored ribosome-binding protein n=1 Tax=Microbacterium immunditiarum TaxID=337480 RepID=A0A7Y9KN16_9MICO|nr:DUF3618 domain-containing protein [Microbacterium immunditiarum]NYE21354.1 ElaB/YqjD/DUF883 family membrane-anchored ribosome-binding protein [Microbacterium immunditiarum]